LFLDQAYKLDVRSLVSAAGKLGYGHVLRKNTPLWVVPGEPWQERPDNHLSAQVTLAAEGAADQSRVGHALLNFVQADGRKGEQMLSLVGMRTANRQWRWRAVCPLTGKLVQTLYLSPREQQFMSCDAAGLSYRRCRRSKIGRCIDRIEAIKRELCATHSGPGIFKPPWMTDARYDELMQRLLRLDVARLHAMLGLGEPDFGDIDVAPEVMYAPPLDPFAPDVFTPEFEPMQVNNRASTSMYYRDKSGTLQMKARYKKKYGLPDGTVKETRRRPHKKASVR
jgi:hypothetical protein